MIRFLIPLALLAGCAPKPVTHNVDRSVPMLGLIQPSACAVGKPPYAKGCVPECLNGHGASTTVWFCGAAR